MSTQEQQTKLDGGASVSTDGLERTGHEALWLWFGLSYASWLTLPRVLMHEMPDEWQKRMAELLREWDETWDIKKMPQLEMAVTMKHGGRFVKAPEWLTNYRHPDRDELAALRSNA
jgi:hypothetical protein